MNDIEQIFQERLEQLEAAEPIESCLEGLPAEEMNALYLIAGIRALSVDDADEASVAAQRDTVLAAAAKRLNSAAASASPGAIFVAHIQTFLHRFLARRELVISLASLLIIVVLGVAFRENSWQPNSDDPGIVASTAIDDAGETSAAEPNISEPVAVDAAEPEIVAETSADALPIVEGPTVYIPMLTSPLNLGPTTAVIEGIQGVVEIQTDADTWTEVRSTTTVAAGQRVRTGKLSQATLSFFDGSQAHLSADTEISIDALNALRPENGFRTVVMTQWSGESDHSVQHRNDGGSLYEVKTPEGSGIARGTKFHVVVEPNTLAQYIVTEGKVDVSGHSRTVSVTAGQLTTLLIGTPPADPVFNIAGEGEVTAVGTVWTIAGQTFQTYAQTIILGNPQVGDLVQVKGHLLADGSRVADRIVLLRRAVNQRFNLSGEVEAIGSIWTIAGQAILVNEQTTFDGDIVEGDSVRVEGIILPGGTLQAQVIIRLEEAPGLPFQFSGIVEAVNESSWIISGQAIILNGKTIVAPNILVGDLVTVSGWHLEDNTWLAGEIGRLPDALPTFEFTGIVQSIEPWRVAGIGFETRSWSVITPAINVGDQVRVSGTILADGTWVADSITSLVNVLPNTITFVGVVGSINPWVINGLSLAQTADTVIFGDVSVGARVVVQVQLLPDGTWAILTLRLLNPNYGYGCLTLSTPIVAVTTSAIQVKHWQIDIKRDGRIKIHGDIKVNSVITVPICTGYDGTIFIVGDIVVIYQPVVVIINNGGGGIPEGCRVTSKGSIKCSGRGSRKS